VVEIRDIMGTVGSGGILGLTYYGKPSVNIVVYFRALYCKNYTYHNLFKLLPDDTYRSLHVRALGRVTGRYFLLAGPNKVYQPGTIGICSNTDSLEIIK